MQCMLFFQMTSTVPCELAESNICSALTLLHRRCATHCQCLTPASYYDPSRCDLCIHFIENVTKAPDAESLSQARSDLY